MHERIKKLRKELGLTQQEFADKLCVKRNTVATYERGRSEASDAAVVLICKTFNVNETWLRTGEGEMLLQRGREEEIAAFLSDLRGGPDFRQKFISVLARMTEDEWAILEKKVLELAQEVQKDREEEQLETEVDKEVELFRKSRLSEREPDAPASSANGSDAV